MPRGAKYLIFGVSLIASCLILASFWLLLWAGRALGNEKEGVVSRETTAAEIYEKGLRWHFSEMLAELPECKTGTGAVISNDGKKYLLILHCTELKERVREGRP